MFWEVGGFDRKKKDERGDIVLMFPQKQNSYSYVENNPLVYVDPSGEESTWIIYVDVAKAYGTFVIAAWTIVWKFISDEIVDRIVDRNDSVSSVTWSPSPGGKKPKKENRYEAKNSLNGSRSISHTTNWKWRVDVETMGAYWNVHLQSMKNGTKYFYNYTKKEFFDESWKLASKSIQKLANDPQVKRWLEKAAKQYLKTK